jgi:hypothetical protein
MNLNFQDIPITNLIVNPSNDRHGNMETEEDAIGWLFSEHGEKMLRLATDLVEQGEVFDAPLVRPHGTHFVVYDGNRRITCLKILSGIIEPPILYAKHFDALIESQAFSKKMKLSCQVEPSATKADEIVSRRHNGTDSGRGQLKWDVRAKANHARRVGGTNQYPIAEAIENYLHENGYPQAAQIKRSTLYRLVNAKIRQTQLGIKLDATGSLETIEDASQVLETLSRIADDIVEGRLTLKHVLNSEGVNEYMKKLAEGGLLFSSSKPKSTGTGTKKPKPKKAIRTSLIPKSAQPNEWRTGQGKIEIIWYELQYNLLFPRHEASIPIVFRTLFELCVDHAIRSVGSPKKTALSAKAQHVARRFEHEGLLSRKELEDFSRVTNTTGSPRELEALHRTVQSSTASLSKHDLVALWNSYEKFLLLCLSK